MKTVFLDIRTWVGTCAIGAIHYYAHLQCGDSRKELKYKLSASQARKMNKLDNVKAGTFGAYSKGEESGRFFTMQELMDYALAHWKDEEYFPDGELLIEGDKATCDPQRVLWCKDDEFMRLANVLYEWSERTFKKGGWDSKKTIPTMKKIEKHWEKLCLKYLKVKWPGYN